MCASVLRIGEASMSAMVLNPYSQSSDQQQHKQQKTEELNSNNLAPSTHVTKTQPKTKRTFKVIIIGDANVGKTCLSFRFCNGRFPVKTEATIGVDFRERSITIDGELLKVWYSRVKFATSPRKMDRNQKSKQIIIPP